MRDINSFINRKNVVEMEKVFLSDFVENMGLKDRISDMGLTFFSAGILMFSVAFIISSL